MARIDLRDASIYLRSGLAGVGQVDNAAGLVEGETTIAIDAVALNTLTPQVVPVGARFTVAGEGPDANGRQVTHVVTAVTTTPEVPAQAGPPFVPAVPAFTTEITFSPAIAAVSAIADDAAITFVGQQIEVRIGEGNLTYTEAVEYEYELDRGQLDSVREGDDQPVQVNLNFVYEFVRTGTNETISPVDALKGIGGAADWISASSDPCQPYSVDLVIEHEVGCSGTSVQREITTFPTFRRDTLAFDLDAASIAVTGRALATEADIRRVD